MKVTITFYILKRIIEANNMTDEFNQLLKRTYNQFKTDPDSSPIPLDTIKEFLENEGVELDESESNRDTD